MTRRHRWGWMSGWILFLALVLAGGGAGVGVGAQEKPVLTWYGYTKLDASWDEGLVNAGNYARWVYSDDVFPGHGHFNMTARQTRLGFRAVTKSGDATLTGRFESDFYGGGAENKNWLQVRHAYVDVVWPSGWSILAGQTSDVVSPLNPGTLNYTVAWWAGNIGYRRPQFRVTRRAKMSGGGEFRVEAAATRTIGDDFVTSEPGDSGADSELPTFQGLMGFAFPVAGRSLGVGVYGHRGEENLHQELGGDPVKVDSWSWGGYLTLPLGSEVTLLGEAWVGSNMDDYLGGIAQGLRVVNTRANAIDARGGWAELQWKKGVTQLHAGFSLDDPDAADLGAGARDRNSAIWGTWIRDAGGGLSYGLEISRWETKYLQVADGASWRTQMSVIYSF